MPKITCDIWVYQKIEFIIMTNYTTTLILKRINNFELITRIIMTDNAPDSSSDVCQGTKCNTSCFEYAYALLIFLTSLALNITNIVIFSEEYDHADGYFFGMSIAAIVLSSMHLFVEAIILLMGCCFCCARFSKLLDQEDDEGESELIFKTSLPIVTIVYRLVTGIFCGIFLYHVEMHIDKVKTLLEINFFASFGLLVSGIMVAIMACCRICKK